MHFCSKRQRKGRSPDKAGKRPTAPSTRRVKVQPYCTTKVRANAMLETRNPELTASVLVAMCDLWAYLTPGRRRQIMVDGLALRLYKRLEWALREHQLGDQEMTDLIAMSRELLQVVGREGLDDALLEFYWQHKWRLDIAESASGLQSWVVALGKTFTADSTEAGPLIDFCRDLGAADG